MSRFLRALSIQTFKGEAGPALQVPGGFEGAKEPVKKGGARDEQYLWKL